MQPIVVRALTADEAAALARLAYARPAPTRAVERARILWQAHLGARAGEIATACGVDAETVRRWITRFNTEGLAGVADRPRSGRPPTYTPTQVAELIAAALTPPEQLGCAFACWTLDRLAAYLTQVKGIRMKRSRIDELLRAEGLRWRKHETWFGERGDPEFAAKRGSSNSSTLRRPRGAPSSASTRWAPRAPRASPATRSSPSRPRLPVRASGLARRSTPGGGAKATASARSAPRRVTR